MFDTARIPGHTFGPSDFKTMSAADFGAAAMARSRSLNSNMDVSSNIAESKFSKLLSIVVSIFIGSVAIFGILNMVENRLACKKLDCEPGDLDKMSQKKFDEMFKNTHESDLADLKDKCTKGFMGNVFIPNKHHTYMTVKEINHSSRDFKIV